MTTNVINLKKIRQHRKLEMIDFHPSKKSKKSLHIHTYIDRYRKRMMMPTVILNKPCTCLNMSPKQGFNWSMLLNLESERDLQRMH